MFPHTHTHTHIYIYIYMCVCVCVKSVVLVFKNFLSKKKSGKFLGECGVTLKGMFHVTGEKVVCFNKVL
jgi:hypothetical protein